MCVCLDVMMAPLCTFPPISCVRIIIKGVLSLPRQVPQAASSYVGNILKPLAVLRGEIPGHYERQWSTSIIEQVTAR